MPLQWTSELKMSFVQQKYPQIHLCKIRGKLPTSVQIK